MSGWATTRLFDLLRRQKDRCFWCDCLIGIPECFGLDVLTCRTHWEFGVLSIGVVTYYGRASVDHLIPRWLKGDHRQSNLVAACQECNHDRGVLHGPGAFETTGFAEWFLNGSLRGRDLRRKVRKITTEVRMVSLREPMIGAMQNRVTRAERRTRREEIEKLPGTVRALHVAERGHYTREPYRF